MNVVMSNGSSVLGSGRRVLAGPTEVLSARGVVPNKAPISRLNSMWSTNMVTPTNSPQGPSKGNSRQDSSVRMSTHERQPFPLFSYRTVTLLRPMIPLGLVALTLVLVSACGPAMAGFPAAFWISYCEMLEAQPVTTKTLTALAGCLCGDILAQGTTHVLSQRKARAAQAAHPQSHATAVPPKFKYNVGHLSRLLLYTLLVTPFLQYWYLFLDARVMPSAPTSPMAVVAKVAADQLCIAPLMTLIYFTFIKALEDLTGGLKRKHLTPGLVFKRATSSAMSKFMPTMLACYMIWPLAHVVNFALVPSSQRILYINAVSILWTAFLSCQAAAGSGSRQQQQQQEVPEGAVAAAASSSSSSSSSGLSVDASGGVALSSHPGPAANQVHLIAEASRDT